jgi:hypothetical protein
VPYEFDNAVFGAIRSATILDIVVVAAAGNGDQDLDAWVQAHPTIEAGFKDSGAILVGAGQPAGASWRRLTVDGGGNENGTNYGSRVDCFAPGGTTRVVTKAGTVDKPFGGTSAASAIIAGIAAAIQGIALDTTPNQPLTSEEIRDWLRAAFNTATTPPNVGIARMPDMRKLVPEIIRYAKGRTGMPIHRERVISTVLDKAAAKKVQGLRSFVGYTSDVRFARPATKADGSVDPDANWVIDNVAGWTRVYLDLDLTRYVDVRTSDIVHFQILSNSANALGGVVLWIDRDAQVISSRVRDAREFLSGDLTSNFLDTTAAFGGSSGPDPVVDPPSFGRPC